MGNGSRGLNERERDKQQRGEKRKPLRPAENRCSACGKKVPDPADEEAHVCVLEGDGKFRASTMREAREEREKKVKEERDRGRS